MVLPIDDFDKEYEGYDDCQCGKDREAWFHPLDHADDCPWRPGERDWLCDHGGDYIDALDALWEAYLKLKEKVSDTGRS